MKRKEYLISAGFLTAALLLAACTAETPTEKSAQTSPASTQSVTSEPFQTTQQSGKDQASTQEQKPNILTVTSIPVDENGHEIAVPNNEIPTQEFVLEPDGKMHAK